MLNKLMNTNTNHEIMGNVWISDIPQEKHLTTKQALKILTPYEDTNTVKIEQEAEILIDNYENLFANSKQTNSLGNRNTTLQNENKDSGSFSDSQNLKEIKNKIKIVSSLESKKSSESAHSKSKSRIVNIEISKESSDLESNSSFRGKMYNK